MKSRFQPKDIHRILDELIKSESDRAVITVGGSLLEYAIETCIQSKFREPQTSDEKEHLFSESGVIGSFSQKIWIAYFLKLIGPQARREFDLIRSIRNIVAHDMNPVSFDQTEKIAERCRQLEFAKSSLPGQETSVNLRGKFLVTVYFFTSALLLRASEPLGLPGVTEALSSLAPYLDR